MAKRQDVLSTEDACPLALPTAPNLKAANTPLVTLGHTPATRSHHRPPCAGPPSEVPEELASGSGLASQRQVLGDFIEPWMTHAISPRVMTVASFVLDFPTIPSLSIPVTTHTPTSHLSAETLKVR